jgi:20S proteasome alpha/beta subunit
MLWPVSSRNGNDSNSMFPIGSLQSSLTASEGHGTVAAIQSFGDIDYVVIVSRSPSESNCNLTRASLANSRIEEAADTEYINHDYNEKDFSGSRNSFLSPITFRGAITRPLQNMESEKNKWKRESKTLHVLHEEAGICLAMTGFASDVKHLVRYVANVVSEHDYLYGGDAPNVHSLVRDTLSSYMRDATTLGGSRPFGAQALVVGNSNGNLLSSGKMQIFTLDPSGNFRHCIGGVATIGKNSELVRQSLCKVLQKDDTNGKDSSTSSVQNCLDIAIESIMINNFDAQNISPSDRRIANQFEAIVVFGGGRSNGRSYSCASLKSDFIFSSYQRCAEAIIQKHKSEI